MMVRREFILLENYINTISPSRQICKKRLLTRKQSEERFLTQLLSYSITQFYFDRIHPELDYKL